MCEGYVRDDVRDEVRDAKPKSPLFKGVLAIRCEG